MTVGVNLAPQVAVLTAANDAPADGVLTSAATFALAVGSLAAANVVVPPDPSNHSLDDLVADLNAAIAGLPSIAGKVQAGRQGSRLTLSTTAQANSPILQLTANAADPAVTQLGFATSQSASGDLTSQFFIQNASASGSVTLATSDLQIAARLGFLDVGVVNGTASATASASVALKDPVSGTPGGRITLKQLTDAIPGGLDSIIETPSIHGSLSMTLPIHVDPDFFGSGQPANPALSVAWTDILDTSTLTVTPNADLVQMLDFSQLSFADIVRAFTQTLQYLQTLKQFSFLNTQLPLLGTSVSGLVDYAADFANKVNALTENPAESLQFVAHAIENAFSLPAHSVTLSVDGHSLRIGLSLTTAFSSQQSINLDLATLVSYLPAGDQARNSSGGRLQRGRRGRQRQARCDRQRQFESEPGHRRDRPDGSAAVRLRHDRNDPGGARERHESEFHRRNRAARRVYQGRLGGARWRWRYLHDRRFGDVHRGLGAPTRTVVTTSATASARFRRKSLWRARSTRFCQSTFRHRRVFWATSS